MAVDTVDPAIRTAVDRVVAALAPQRVYLFGSRARGDHRPDSDVDLLFVMPEPSKPRDMAVAARLAMGKVPFAVDVLVTTPEAYEWRKKYVGTIERPVSREGILLYDTRCFLTADDEQRLVELLQDWLEKAEGDLASAALLVKHPEIDALQVVCFLAQQCIEKYLKANLVRLGSEFPFTHDLVVLMAAIPEASRPSLTGAEAVTITRYAVTHRYPTPQRRPTLADARKALAAARRVRREVRRHLPRAALRRKT